MGNKRRRVQLFNVQDDLTCREWFMAFGRCPEDEVKLVIKNGQILRAEHDGHILPDPPTSEGNSPLMTHLWKWLAHKYAELQAEEL